MLQVQYHLMNRDSGLPPGQPSPYAPPGPLTARPHVCEYCDSGFARAHDLKRHLETHKVRYYHLCTIALECLNHHCPCCQSERPHKCPNCQRSFSRKDAVRIPAITVCVEG